MKGLPPDIEADVLGKGQVVEGHMHQGHELLRGEAKHAPIRDLPPQLVDLRLGHGDGSELQ